MKHENFKDFAIEKAKKEYPFIIESDNFYELINKFSDTFNDIESNLNTLYNLNIKSELKINAENSILKTLYDMFINAFENSDNSNKNLINYSLSKNIFEKFILDILKGSELSKKEFLNLNLNKNVLVKFYLELLNILNESDKNIIDFKNPSEYSSINYKTKLECLLKANLKFNNILKLENITIGDYTYNYRSFNIIYSIYSTDLLDKLLNKLFNTEYGSTIIYSYFDDKKKYGEMIKDIGLENIIKDNLFKSLSHKSLDIILKKNLKNINLGVLSDLYYDNSKLFDDKLILDSLLNELPSDFKNTMKKHLIKYINKTYFINE